MISVICLPILPYANQRQFVMRNFEQKLIEFGQ